MRSKAPLALLEQLVMLLVFALAAALCVRAFALAEQNSKWNEARDRAVLETQNAAEILKHRGQAGGTMEETLREAAEVLGGYVDQGVLYVYYDEEWKITGPEDAEYRLCAWELSAPEGLLKAEVRMEAAVAHFLSSVQEPLFTVNVAWQEAGVYE